MTNRDPCYKLLGLTALLQCVIFVVKITGEWRANLIRPQSLGSTFFKLVQLHKDLRIRRGAGPPTDGSVRPAWKSCSAFQREKEWLLRRVWRPWWWVPSAQLWFKLNISACMSILHQYLFLLVSRWKVEQHLGVWIASSMERVTCWGKPICLPATEGETEKVGAISKVE